MNEDYNTRNGLPASIIDRLKLIEYTDQEKKRAGVDFPGRKSYHTYDNQVIIENIHPHTRSVDNNCWYIYAGKREIRITHTFLNGADDAPELLIKEISKALDSNPFREEHPL